MPAPVVELGIMGMPIVLDLRDEIDPAAVEEMWKTLRRADGLFSTYSNDSEISRLNRNELMLDDASAEVRDVLARCRELSVVTDGYFDAWRVLPHGVDREVLVHLSPVLQSQGHRTAGRVFASCREESARISHGSPP